MPPKKRPHLSSARPDKDKQVKEASPSAPSSHTKGSRGGGRSRRMPKGDSMELAKDRHDGDVKEEEEEQEGKEGGNDDNHSLQIDGADIDDSQMKLRSQPERKARIGGTGARKSKRPQVCKLKLQIQPRSLSDSCSSGLPSQLRKNCELKQQSPARSVTDCRFSTAATMKHPWTVEEELYVLQPLATSHDVRQTYFKDKKVYRETVAIKMNETFGIITSQYVELDDAKVLRKFGHFGRRYKQYQLASDHIIQDPNTAQKNYELVEIYIAQWGWIFIDETSSASTSSLTNSSKRKRGQDEEEILKAARLMEGHCSNKEFTFYLCALQSPTVRLGFLVKPDIQSKKKWLDDQVQLLDEEMPGWWKQRM